MKTADLKAYDHLVTLLHALDKKLTRLEERVTTLAYDVEQLKQQQRPVDAIGRQR